jgi:hypothetical protein
MRNAANGWFEPKADHTFFHCEISFGAKFCFDFSPNERIEYSRPEKAK